MKYHDMVPPKPFEGITLNGVDWKISKNRVYNHETSEYTDTGDCSLVLFSSDCQLTLTIASLDKLKTVLEERSKK